MDRETIGARIARLRAAKGWSRPELGRRMAATLKRAKPFSGEVVRLYEENETRPGRDARQALALVFERPEAYIEFGDATQTRKVQEPAPLYTMPKNAREEMLLELFRGMTPEQQREQILEMNALVEGNRQVQTRFLNRPLRTFGNEDVAAAFGPVPSPRKNGTKRRRGAASAEEDPE